MWPLSIVGPLSKPLEALISHTLQPSDTTTPTEDHYGRFLYCFTLHWYELLPPYYDAEAPLAYHLGSHLL
jgi:hypothetical protein